MQQNIEVATGQFFADIAVCAQAKRFIKSDKLDAVYFTDQAMLVFADDPGDLRFRPVMLQGSQNRQGVCNVADRRQAQNAY